MSFENRYFTQTEESRDIFRKLRHTLWRFDIKFQNPPLKTTDTHAYCLKYARIILTK